MRGDPILRTQAVRLYTEGYPPSEICLLLDVAPSTFRNWTDDITPPKRRCEICQLKFTPSRANQQYCSRACRNRRYYDQRTSETKKRCPVCQRRFVPTPRKRYCSFKCKDAAAKRRR